MLLVGSALEGYAIHARDGKIGSVTDLLFDDTTWKIRWLVVDTGNWLTGRIVLIHPSAIEEADHGRQELAVRLTKQQVKDSPDILQDRPVSQQMESDLYSYYGWDPVWGGSYFGPGAMASAPFNTDTMVREPVGVGMRLTDGDPHLRSIRTVNGYHVHATDGDIGHVSDFLVDEHSWAIRYLIVDTTNWWAGKEVLLSPSWIERVDWHHSKVHATVTRAQIRNSPEFDPTRPVERAYEERLYGHYGQPHYWGE